MDEQERQKKLEAGKAKLAQFRQRKAYSDGQHVFKKQKKKKKISKVKDEELIQEGLDINQLQTEEASLHSFQRGAAATTEPVTVRTLHSDEMIKHDQTYTTELESEISTPADDYSSEAVVAVARSGHHKEELNRRRKCRRKIRRESFG